MTTAPLITDDFTRTFPVEGFDPTRLEDLKAYIDGLHAMSVETVEELKEYLEALDVFEAYCGEHYSKTRIRTVQDTQRVDLLDEWNHIMQNILPFLEKEDDRLNRKVLASPALQELEGTAYDRWVRGVQVSAELFRDENIELNKRENELTTEYNKISGSWLVDFDGEKWPMPAMQQFLNSADRDIRQRAFEASTETMLADRQRLDEMFHEMVALRHKIATNAGKENYVEFMFRRKLRDYDPDACTSYHALIREEVVPLLRELESWHQEQLGVDRYQIWDSGADLEGGEVLRPFKEARELDDGVLRMLKRLDGELGRTYDQIRQGFDLASRPNKGPGGFMSWLRWSRRPFIFANATGVHMDIVTLLHEAGHAFHSLASVDNAPMSSISAPMEFKEVASMAMELLPYPMMDEFYDADERRRAIRTHIMRVVRVLVSVARGDAFQLWMYENPDHSIEDRYDLWTRLRKEYGGAVDLEGIDPVVIGSSWHGTLHYFIVPFYYIEYGFAQLGALQIAVNANRDRQQALSQYKHALSLAATRDTAGLYEAAGAEFVPRREKLRELMGWLREQFFGEQA